MPRIRSGSLVLVVLLLSACTDQLVSETGLSSSEQGIDVSSKMRLSHKVSDAQSNGRVAGKSGTTAQTHLYLAFGNIQADGVTRRVLDEWGVTRRILMEYGVTRRVLQSYGLDLEELEKNGITRRVLESYQTTLKVLPPLGITAEAMDAYVGEIDEAFLDQYGISLDELEDQGITRRVLDEYGITRRVLETYGLTAAELQEQLESFTSSVVLKVRIKNGVPGITVKIDDKDLEAILVEILNDARIAFVEPDYSMTVDPLLREQTGRGNDQVIPWNIDHLGVLATDYNAESVDVYILDSGVLAPKGRDKGTSDLNIVEQKDFTMLFQNRDQDLFDDADFEPLPYFDPGTTGDPGDPTGHGTHIAGVLGAIDNQEGVLGAAPGARIHSLKVLTDAGRTDVTTVVSAIDYVVHARETQPDRPIVMNLSFGADIGTKDYSVVDEAVERAIDAGIVVVVSAGNDGRDAETYSPAHVKRAITVGAYAQSMTAATFSNYGKLVDLYAPGEAIVSLSNDPDDYGRDSSSRLESGTSMAAPHVAGAAAQYLSLNPEASPKDVEKALVEYAVEDLGEDIEGKEILRVYVGDFGRSAIDEKPFSAEAEWKSDKKGDLLKVKGEGRRAERLTLLDSNGGIARTIFIGQDGKWKAEISGLPAPPCSLTLQFGHETHVVPVMDGKHPVRGCDTASEIPSASELVFRKVEWSESGRGKGLKIEIKGPKNGVLDVKYGVSQNPLFSGTFGKRGDFRRTIDIPDPADVPCSITVWSGGASASFDVTNAPPECSQ